MDLSMNTFPFILHSTRKKDPREWTEENKVFLFSGRKISSFRSLDEYLQFEHSSIGNDVSFP